jgi:hypothetical protein
MFLVAMRALRRYEHRMENVLEISEGIRALVEFRRKLARTPPNRLDCVELEREVLQITKSIGREAMKEVFERADCPEPELRIDGVHWGNRRSIRATYTTLFGDVTVERGTYQQGGHGPVAVPVELRLAIVEGRYTPQVTRVLTRATALMPAQEGADFLQEVGLCQVSVSTLHRVPRAIAARYETRREQVNRELRQREAVPDEAVTVQVSLDGVMVPQDGEHAKPRGRKVDTPDPPRHEQRYGPVGRVGPAPTDDEAGRAWHEASVGTLAFYDSEGNHLRTIYLCQMPQEGKKALAEDLEKELLWALSARPDLNLCFASDGAPPQWKILEGIRRRLPGGRGGDAVYLLDFWHAASYVHETANLIEGEGTAASKVLATSWKETLKTFSDGPARVLKSMRYRRNHVRRADREKFDKAVAFLAKQSRRGRMRYAAAQTRGYPIGTGVTEAAAKTIVHVRMKRAGARFSQHGGQTIMTFRTAVLSDRFERLSELLEATYTARLQAA